MKIRKILALLIGGAVFSSACASAFATDFADIPDDWSREDILWAIDSNIITGDGEYVYPDNYIKRAELAAMLVRSMGLEEEDETRYYDVRTIAWYHPYVSKISAAGIMTGDRGLFRPEENITRQEAVAAIARAYGYSEAEGDLSRFDDGKDVASWAKDCFAAMVKKGIITGYGGALNPKDYITRKETAAILHRIYKAEIMPVVDENGALWTPAQ